MSFAFEDMRADAVRWRKEAERYQRRGDDLLRRLGDMRDERDEARAEIERLRRVEAEAREVYPAVFAMLTENVHAGRPWDERCALAANEVQQAFLRLPGEELDPSRTSTSKEGSDDAR